MGSFTLARARVDFVSDTIKVALVTSAYTPDQDAHDFWDDVSANEVASGGGYTTGGVALTTKTVTYDATTNECRLDADDPAWTALTATFRYAIARKARGGAASADELLGYIDFGADQTLSGVNFTIQLAATGLLKMTAA
jgi:hypothetical protein